MSKSTEISNLHYLDHITAWKKFYHSQGKDFVHNVQKGLPWVAYLMLIIFELKGFDF